MKVDQDCLILQIFQQQNLTNPKGTKHKTFFMHLQFHKTLFFSMTRMARWLADCPAPRSTCDRRPPRYLKDFVLYQYAPSRPCPYKRQIKETGKETVANLGIILFCLLIVSLSELCAPTIGDKIS